MLDLNFVRENLPLVEEKLRQRGMDPATVLKDFREVDTQRRQAITEAETSKAQRNKASEEIAKLKKSGQDASAAMAQTKDLREKIQTLEKTAADLDTRLRDILAGIPNIPHASVPVGQSAEQNVEVRRWGAPPKFDFAPKAHWDLGAELGILDLERAVKLTGARFAVYWDLGAKLERALMNFMLDLHTRQHGYTEVLPPYLVNSESMYGTGQLPKFAADSFRVPHGDKDLWLIPTAEVPVTNLYRDEVLRSDAPADLAHCLYTLFPQRGGIVRERCTRHHPATSVSESGIGQVHTPGQLLRGTRKTHARCRRSLAEARTALSRGYAVRRRHGAVFGEDI